MYMTIHNTNPTSALKWALPLKLDFNPRCRRVFASVYLRDCDAMELLTNAWIVHRKSHWKPIPIMLKETWICQHLITYMYVYVVFLYKTCFTNWQKLLLIINEHRIYSIAMPNHYLRQAYPIRRYIYVQYKCPYTRTCIYTCMYCNLKYKPY
jgi:hypothetical protein